jgi:SAM-dependent methyltransferase
MRSIEAYRQALWNTERDLPLLYQPLEHPAFADWAAMQPCTERWEMIAEAIDIQKPGTVLDLGCHTGWFCRQFSRHGWQAIGIDRKGLEIEIASELMRPWDGKPPPIYRLEDLAHAVLPAANVALCLSLIMYIWPKPGWELLNRISQAAPVMFCDWGGMYAGRMPFAGDWLPFAITQRTQYTRFTKLGNTALESRPLFIFERP